MTLQDKILSVDGTLTVGETPEGYDALVIADLVRANKGQMLLHIARDDARLAALAETLSFFAPDIEILRFPAWDCLPYDRVSPQSEIVAHRMATLGRLIKGKDADKPRIVLTTINSALQRVPPRELLEEGVWSATIGDRIDLDGLTSYLTINGYARTGTVREPGEFALRGGIVDLFPPDDDIPLRLDLFGDTLDAIRTFDPENQLTTGKRQRIDLVPVSEIHLDPDAVRRFRAGYVAAFGAVSDADPLYEAVSEGRKHHGMEHWLPLFHDRLDTLFDYLPDTMISEDQLVGDARAARLELIADYYEARQNALAMKNLEGTSFKPLPPEKLYLDEAEWCAALEDRQLRIFTPFAVPESDRAINLGAKEGRSFAPERQQEGVNIFDALGGYITELRAVRKRVAIASWSVGARERLHGVLKDHGVDGCVETDDWASVLGSNPATVHLIVLGLETGFSTDDLAIISEQDVLGDRLVRRHRKKRADNFLKEASSLSPGDVVVHIDHGIARFDGLQTIDVAGAPHDCLVLLYHGGDKLFLPVENIELLSRYGSDDTVVQMDRLGGTGWQARKAKLKERITEMAGELIKIAAARALKTAPRIHPQDGAYEEFCARFPFEETDDQLSSIESVVEDLGKGRPMDRLICGDVGFGKTEVALRAAFLAALEGKQVAIVVPTTLLARQHHRTFVDRFKGLPVRIGRLSRLVAAKEATATREELASGQMDIVIGTHALLAKSIKFKDLGLVIVDEEQRFGVGHKERLKQLRTDVHVLTLTATPIPRTLQLALSGVRELSIIATPPVDRLAVRTYVTPFDPVVVREAILREHYRGGQSFYVCPRIVDLREIEEFLRDHIPEVKFVTAHGQMSPSELEDKMTAFYDGQYDVLLSTTIVESGLDIPAANTLIIHRADMFGLAQLYQLRGRVGRSKSRAYAYFTTAATRSLTANAEKRLRVLQSLDSLGAGFTLASHDLDIRGAGNLLGDEQSGHIREVGYELYQEMLEEAVAQLRGDEGDGAEQWSPQINVGTPVLIPDHYVTDLDARMALYRRLSQVETRTDIDGFAAELIDRFGPLPDEVNSLLKIVEIKGLCRVAGIEKIDAGPKGGVLTFRDNAFANPVGLVEFINDERDRAKLRPDHKLVFKRAWDLPEDRLEGAFRLARKLAEIAKEAVVA